MKANIYQLPVEENACFRDLDTVLSVEKKIDLNKYKIVGAFKITEFMLDSFSFPEICESLFNFLNSGEKPDGYYGRSLSVSDIVEIDGKYFYCDDMGFKEIWFDKDGIYR